MRKLLKRGLIAVLPVLVTVGVFYLVADFLISKIGRPVGAGIHWIVHRANPPEPFPWQYDALGTAAAIVIFFLVAALVSTFLGKRLHRLFETLVNKIPLLNKIYPYARQFTDFFISDGEQKVQFKTAVAVPFPLTGSYALGFVVNEGFRTLNETTAKRLIGCFVPTAPAPMTGFLLFVPREDVVPLPISVEEAFRTIVSLGILVPTDQTVTATSVRMGSPGPYAVPSSLLPATPAEPKP